MKRTLSTACAVLLALAPDLAVASDPIKFWDTAGPIQVGVISPSNDDRTGDPPGHYLLVNHSLGLLACASDHDRFEILDEGWSAWYDYYDEVQTGGNASNCHMLWAIADGDGRLLQEFGAQASYLAGGPMQDPENNPRSILLGVAAWDYDRSEDDDHTTDNNDGFGSASITIKVWQLVVTMNASHDADCGIPSDPNLLPAYAASGGTHLGWVRPNEPNDCICYARNCEFTGTIPNGPSVAGLTFAWVQTASGDWWATRQGSTEWAHIPPWDPIDDSPDADGSQTTPVNRKIFFIDAPGFIAGAGNNAGIADGYTETGMDCVFESFVMCGGWSVSNSLCWSAAQTLVVGGEPPRWQVQSVSPSP